MVAAARRHREAAGA